ncbi:UDP-N-acetylmuramate--L-alanine ligase [Planotetraspora kaengkrachanensis]|uniref:UDP-N-acetylmuramate--L-alanine ligase n=1 Tax=Planotetraspora kaengkrachanensis TaxID=575193 RepID=A0A8J3PTA4_9ACTN|nr:UDP-N-acetylmuramate--L-alanine ligase [Planotetraspora kaengkrachanensis]GIG79496.1 UDP-N-acetylmuramate--L-alanine ligase [Planotetraspora kaengkrachanensis]
MSPSVPALPVNLLRPHFIGIGGAGMSGIAKILNRRGARVTGSDAHASASTGALRDLGVTVRAGHDAANVPADASCVVVSSAIPAGNPELALATELGIPVVHRSQALVALMEGHRTIAIAGTHGKTTTTSMLAVALTVMGADPSYAIGADLDVPGSNAHQGDGGMFVAEADESDRSFQIYTPEVAVVLNVEFEHHANYASLEEIYESFAAFAGRIIPTGSLVISADHEGARELTRRLAGRGGPRIVTYGRSPEADVRILDITLRGMTSRVVVLIGGERLTFTVSVPGRHYAHDAVAALAAGHAFGLPARELAPALAAYTGARRRLEPKGEVAGIRVVDTYAHHPTEMTADLEALRETMGGSRLLVVYQPHLFSRTLHLGAAMGEALALADASVVLDIYPAREQPIPGVTSDLVVAAARDAGARVTPVHDMAAVPSVVAAMARPHDVVVTMGGGDVTTLGPRILAALSRSGADAGRLPR